jgi:hypothetical protein
MKRETISFHWPHRFGGVTLLSLATASSTGALLAGCTGSPQPQQQAASDAAGGTVDGHAVPDGTSVTDGGAQVDVTTGEGGEASSGGSTSDGGTGGGSSSSGGGTGGGSSGESGEAAAPLDAAVHDAGPDGDAADEEAAPVVLVPFQSGREISGIAVDSTYVYWTASGSSDEALSDAGTFVGIMRVPKSGGAPTAVYNEGAVAGDIGNTLYVDSTSVYFELYTCCPIAHSFLKVAKDGSTDAGAAQVLGQQGDPGGTTDFAMDGVNVYFASGGGIYSVPVGGGSQGTVVNTTGASPVDPVGGQSIGFPPLFSLVTDGTNVYYAAGLGPSAWILKVPVGGGTPAIVASSEVDAGPGGPYASDYYMHPTANGGFIYWTGGSDPSGGTGALYRASADGGSPILLAASTTDPNPVTDGTNVYYLTGTSGGGNGALMKVPVAGGPSVVVVHERGRYDFGAIDLGGISTPIAVDDTSVYLMANSDQGIVKAAK